VLYPVSRKASTRERRVTMVAGTGSTQEIGEKLTATSAPGLGRRHVNHSTEFVENLGST
jgi:hypothetical protein